MHLDLQLPRPLLALLLILRLKLISILILLVRSWAHTRSDVALQARCVVREQLLQRIWAGAVRMKVFQKWA